jgi:hypothetical protein
MRKHFKTQKTKASRDVYVAVGLSSPELVVVYIVQKRGGRREKLRRRTVRHGYQILERGIEEQKACWAKVSLCMTNGSCVVDY